MPIIEGGTYRVWSRTQDLQLSAEQSYDPNMEPDNQSLLHYHWVCQSTSKVRRHFPHCADKERDDISVIKLAVSVTLQCLPGALQENRFAFQLCIDTEFK